VTRFTCRFKTKFGFKELDCIAKKSLPNIILLTGREMLDICDFCENGIIPLHKVEPDGNVLWANKSQLKILGYDHDEYIGHKVGE
jgi:hypothetical protein